MRDDLVWYQYQYCKERKTDSIGDYVAGIVILPSSCN